MKTNLNCLFCFFVIYNYITSDIGKVLTIIIIFVLLLIIFIKNGFLKKELLIFKNFNIYHTTSNLSWSIMVISNIFGIYKTNSISFDNACENIAITECMKSY